LQPEYITKYFPTRLDLNYVSRFSFKDWVNLSNIVRILCPRKHFIIKFMSCLPLAFRYRYIVRWKYFSIFLTACLYIFTDPGILGFGSPRYNFSCSDPQLVIPVHRSSGADGAVALPWFTRDSTAVGELFDGYAVLMEHYRRFVQNFL